MCASLNAKPSAKSRNQSLATVAPTAASTLLPDDDYRLFVTLGHGEWAVIGFRAADLRARLARLSPSRRSHLLKRLRLHGLTKKIGHHYKYYLSKLGRRVDATTFTIRAFVVVRSLGCA